MNEMLRSKAFAISRFVRTHAFALLLCFTYVLWLFLTARTLGFCRDESFYFDAGAGYAKWLELLVNKPAVAIKPATVDASFSYNHEHPSLMKLLFGASELLLNEKWHLPVDKTTSFRLPGMVFGGMGVWLTYRLGRERFGARAGLFAAAALAFLPRVFYHAHLACFDVPVMTMWLASICAYDALLRRGGLWRAVWLGVVFGLTLETKHNAWMLPPLFIVHQVWLGLHRGKDARAQTTRGLLGFVCMALLGPAIFVGLWPWLWHDTVPRIQEYVGFHLNHEYYNMEFLGKNYFSAPSPKLYAPVMILATVPLVTLALAFFGGATRAIPWLRSFPAWLRARLRKDHVDGTVTRPVGADMLLLLAFAVPLAPFFLPKTPIFGGTKHWFPAYPFLAMFAGYGFRIVVVHLARFFKKSTRVVSTLVMAACILGPIAMTVHSHPFGLSSYVPIVGGNQGAATIGLNRQFWGFTTQSLSDYLARSAKPGDRIYVHDTTYGAFAHMQEEKRLRADIQFVGTPGEADIAIVHHELHMIEVETNIWVAMERTDPDYVLTHDGVPIISVYLRRK